MEFKITVLLDINGMETVVSPQPSTALPDVQTQALVALLLFYLALKIHTGVDPIACLLMASVLLDTLGMVTHASSSVLKSLTVFQVIIGMV